MIKLLGFKINKDELQTLKNIQKYIGHDTKIVDIQSFEPITTDEDILIIFGKKAKRQTNNLPAKKVIYLGEVSKLHSELGELAERQIARDKLDQLKKELSDNNKIVNSSINIDTSDLPEVSLVDTLNHFRYANNKEKDYVWTLNMKNGKVIRVSLEPETSNADINMTFQELIALKVAIDTLGIQGVEIVYRNINSK